MAQLPLRIDYALAMASGLGGSAGLEDAHLAAEAPAFERGLRRIQAEAEAGRLGFWNLPRERTSLRRIEEAVPALLEGVEDVLLLGIGGSSLGARAIYHALCGPAELRRGGPRLHLPDNSDPWTLARMMEQLDPRRTLVVAISKSGGTVETMAQLLILRSWLSAAGGEKNLRRRLVLITDPERGSLRAMARDENLRAFEVPSNVGGRFSVLSSVGLLPARLMGLDAAALLDGAEAMADACANPRLQENPAGILATLHVLHHRLHQRSIHILMPYADALRPFAAWYVQLWAESLGKRLDRRGCVVERGPTPLAALGATDQHAQMQLFVEGPRDKIITFVGVSAPAVDLTIPSEDGPLSYLGGQSMGALLDAERRATMLALARDGRPSVSLMLESISERSLGALFFLYEAATAIAGELYGVDAFDQPGVEEGKRLASGLLGREGYEEARDEVLAAESARTSRYRIR